MDTDCIFILPAEIIQHIFHFIDNFYDQIRFRNASSNVFRSTTITKIDCNVRFVHLTDAKLKLFPYLEYLSAPYSSITSIGLQYVPNLKYLNITQNHAVTDDGLKHVPKLQSLIACASLGLTSNCLMYVPNLTELDVSANHKMRSESFKYVTNLTKLSVNYNAHYITDDALKYLPNLETLEAVFISGITDEGLKYVTKLKSLNICDNWGVTDEGLRYVTSLTELNASGCESRITNVGILYLKNLKRLRSISNRNITINVID